jgi:hypothetical protein
MFQEICVLVVDLPAVTQCMMQHGFSLLLGSAWDADEMEYGHHFGECCT